MLRQRLRSALMFRLDQNYRCINLYGMKLKCSEVNDAMKKMTCAQSVAKRRFCTSHSFNKREQTLKTRSEFVDDLFGQSETQRHTCTAEAGYNCYIVFGFS